MIKTEFITSNGKRFSNIVDAEIEENKLNSVPRTLVFYGSSDDLRYVDTVNGKMRSHEPDEFYTDVLILEDSKGQGFKVVYTYFGCWAIGIAQLSEDHGLPEWFNTRWETCGYTMKLYVDVPGDVNVTEEKNND